jgi:hypothetical protein
MADYFFDENIILYNPASFIYIVFFSFHVRPSISEGLKNFVLFLNIFSHVYLYFSSTCSIIAFSVFLYSNIVATSLALNHILLLFIFMVVISELLY